MTARLRRPAPALPLAGPRTSPGPGLAVFRRPGGAMAAISALSISVVGAGAAMGLTAGAAALVGVVVGLIVLIRPAVGALVLVGVVPTVSGFERGLPVPGIRLSELLILGVGLTVLLTAERRVANGWRTFDWLALAYCLVTAVVGAADVVGRGDGFTGDQIGELLGPFQFLLLYRATVTALRSPQECRMALRALLLGSLAVSLLTTLQQLNLAGVRNLLMVLTGFDPAIEGDNRATGPFPHWHELGGFTFQIVLLVLALWLGESRRVLPRPLLVGVALLGAACLLLTATLAPILGGTVGAIALALWYRRGARVALGLVVLGVLGMLAFGPLLSQRLDQQFDARVGRVDTGPVPQTVAYRYGVWTKQYLPAIAERPLAGYGPGTPPEVTWEFTESSYITMLVRGGLPLLLVFLALSWAIVALAGSATGPGDDDRRALGRTLVVVGTIMIPLQLIAPYFVLTGPPHVLWALVGVLVAWRGIDAPQRALRRPRALALKCELASATQA